MLLLGACSPNSKEPVSIVWTNEKATGLVIRHLQPAQVDLLKLEVRVLGNVERAPVLGTFAILGDEIIFTPVVPLTRGLHYELVENEKVFGRIAIPTGNPPIPEIVGVYPRVDTVPENLLKMHLVFSQPMQEGKSGQFIILVENGRDTLDGTFLDLQPELWNETGHVLTLWLDPGRIKLDLIPNKNLGNPLSKGARYELILLPGWKSKEGILLQPMVLKTFFVGARDDQSPSVDQWRLRIPATSSTDPLEISFNEPLDWLLARECIWIAESTGERAEHGNATLNLDVSGVQLFIEKRWKPGRYYVGVESRLEDLAGNNLNRLFEVDLNKPGTKREQKASFTITFEVK